MGSDKAKGQTYLNYLVPRKYGDARGFQAGSTFKAFVLATAITQGIPLSTRINAPQTVSIPESRYRTCDGYLHSADTWNPQNSTGVGTFNLYTGTQLSVNTFYAQLEERTGLCGPTTLAKKMGVVVPDNDIVGPFTLGVTDVDPLTMASVYATFAGRGRYCAPRPVTAVLNSAGKTIEDYPGQCKQLVRADVADAVNDILKGVQEPGGFGYKAGSRWAAVRGQDRHDERQPGRLVHRLHPEPRGCSDDRRRELRATRSRSTGRRSAGSTSPARTAPPRPDPCGATP